MAEAGVKTAIGILGSLGEPRRARGPSRGVLFALAILAALAFLYVTYDPKGIVSIVAAGAVGLALVAIGVVYTTRHRDWLMPALVAVEVMTSTFMLHGNPGTVLRYGLEFLMFVPAFPILWRSGILSKGGFKLFTIYMCWAVITVTYSLSPMFSLGRAFNTGMLLVAVWVCALEVERTEDVGRIFHNYLLVMGVIVAMMVAAFVVLPRSLTMSSDKTLDAAGYLVKSASHLSTGGIARFTGIFTQPNAVGALALVVVGPCLVYWRYASRFEKLLLVLMIGASLGFAALADSRSSVGAVFAGIALYVVWRYRWRGALACAALTLVLAVGVLSTSKHAREYFTRGNVSTLTGRTDIWKFAVHEIAERPLLGYGYEVEGEIFQSKYFPIWWGPWDEGPHSSLHNNYLSHAIGVGIPAALFWLFIVLWPWFTLFRQKDDLWGLKPIFFLVVVPVLILNCAESSASDCRSAIGLLFVLAWALAEKYRLRTIVREREARQEGLARMPRAMAALLSSRVVESRQLMRSMTEST